MSKIKVKRIGFDTCARKWIYLIEVGAHLEYRVCKDKKEALKESGKIDKELNKEFLKYKRSLKKGE